MRHWSEGRGPTGVEGSLLTPQETVKLVLNHGPNSSHLPQGESMMEVERNMARRAKELDMTEEDLDHVKEDLGTYVKEAFHQRLPPNPRTNRPTKPELLWMVSGLHTGQRLYMKELDTIIDTLSKECRGCGSGKAVE